MSEGAPKFESEKMTKAEYIRLAEKLSRKTEVLQFFGLDDSAYAEINNAEKEYSGWGTHIDELVGRFCDSGMKVSLGENPQTGNVFILPGDSDNIEEDSVSPRQLMVRSEMDSELIKLIFASRKGVS